MMSFRSTVSPYRARLGFDRVGEGVLEVGADLFRCEFGAGAIAPYADLDGVSWNVCSCDDRFYSLAVAAHRCGVEGYEAVSLADSPTVDAEGVVARFCFADCVFPFFEPAPGILGLVDHYLLVWDVAVEPVEPFPGFRDECWVEVAFGHVDVHRAARVASFVMDTAEFANVVPVSEEASVGDVVRRRRCGGCVGWEIALRVEKFGRCYSGSWIGGSFRCRLWGDASGGERGGQCKQKSETDGCSLGEFQEGFSRHRCFLVVESYMVEEVKIACWGVLSGLGLTLFPPNALLSQKRVVDSYCLIV